MSDRYDILQRLEKHLTRSKQTYAYYMADDKRFIYTIFLKHHNIAALGILSIYKECLPPDLRADAEALIYHYRVWINLWKDLKKEIVPTLRDRFVFENAITFPREAEARIIGYCRSNGFKTG